MRHGYRIPVIVLCILAGLAISPPGLPAQEESQLTDFRTHSSYTAEELGAALFPPAAAPVQTRGVLLRPPQSPPGVLLKKASVVIPVLFETNSAVILPQYYDDLAKLGAQLTAPHYREYRVQIEGHTDNRGSVLYNQKLSEKRARSVQQYLIQTFAIAPERLPIKGYGPSMPIASNSTETGRSQNRRIEVANFGR
jgi:outer membrane protein OmpA-like peptidoglycan-associated protein